MKKLLILFMVVVVAVISAGMLARQTEAVAIQESTTTPQEQEVDLLSVNDSMEISKITTPKPNLMENIQSEIAPSSPTPNTAAPRADEIETTLILENPTPPPKPEPPSQPKPQTEKTPKSGDRNDNGDIFVPGFGWISDNGGGNIVTIAPNAGTGDIVGIMG